MTYYRIQFRCPTDELNAEQKIRSAVAMGWTPVDMFKADFVQHHEYLAKFREIHDWVCENVGRGDLDWFCTSNVWCFKDVNKALMFKLTWGGQ